MYKNTEKAADIHAEQLTDEQLDETAQAMGMKSGEESRAKLREMMEKAQSAMRELPPIIFTRSYRDIRTDAALENRDLAFTLPEGTVFHEDLLDMLGEIAATVSPVHEETSLSSKPPISSP